MLTIVAFDVLLLVVLLMFSIPLPYCFGGALLFMSVFGEVSMRSMTLWAFDQMINPVLLASPLFILAGTLMGGSGIARKLLDFVDVFIGHIKGGLGVVCCVTCAIIGAISGSGFTGVAATAPIMIPRMVEQGYPRGYATALLTVASILGLLIPPSGIMILYGWITETSILACFLSTLLPGLAITFLLSVINMAWARNFDLKLENYEVIKARRREIVPRAFNALPALMMPVVVLGGIYGGVFTATEAAAVAAAYSVPVGFLIYRGFLGGKFFPLVRDAAASIGAIMTMILFCLMLSQTFVILKVPQAIVEIVFNLTQNRTVLLILINIFLFGVGMVVNDATGMILVAPLLLPLMKELGITPVHFGAIMGVNLAMGGVTPPYASILYLGMRLGKCSFQEILPPTLTFLIFGYVPVVFLTTFWPPIALFIPNLFGFN
ncbi:MAG: TRAP transporter large permease [Synergistaceae bacterium]|jgi:tripartite ATP-independent transporter DctM subunit|nr:TRAP transporter large permease [Synergistaceae bacterium]